MTPASSLDPGCPTSPGPREESASADPAQFVQRAKGRNILDLTVRGARCGGCLAKIEGAARELAGVQEARLNLSTGRMHVEWEGGLAASDITGTIRALGYGVTPYLPEAEDAARKSEERSLLIAMAVAGFAMANIMLLSVSVWSGTVDMGETTRTLMHMISGAIAIPAVLFSGQVFFRSAFQALRRGRANMDVPVALALVLALGVSIWETAKGGEHAYFDAACMLMFFLLIGRFLDARLRRRAHAAVHDLAALRVHTASRIAPDGSLVSVRASELQPGDMIAISAGERACVDFEIVSGTASLDESLVSGESLPRQAGPGSRVHAGTMVLDASLQGRALSTAAASLLSEIEGMLEAGEQRRSAYRRFAERAVSLYVPLVHSTALATFLGWLWMGAAVDRALFVAISTLIITCPCALALATPVAQVVAASRLFRRGVFLKSGDALERLARVDHIVFDKTGTLTLGEPQLLGTPDRALVERAARLARASRHPLSRAIAAAAGVGPLASDVREHAGLGLEGDVDGVACRLGSAEWTGAAAGQAGLGLWFVEGEGAPFFLAMTDALKPDAAQTVAQLRAQGRSVEILSGDRSDAVAAIARQLGIETWTAGAKPAEKVARLEALRAEGRRVLMVGDGLNDAGALSLAFASMAPGRAMDVSQSACDAVFSGESLSAVPATLDIAGGARATMIENLALAFGYNLIAIPIAVAGYASPLVAAIAMSASSIVVTLNALRPHGPGGQIR